MHKSLLSVVAFAACSSALSAQTPSTLVVPAAAATADLAESTRSPFSRNPAERVLYIYDASHFAGITTPIAISQISLRADADAGSWAGDIQDPISLDLSTATVDYADANAVFDSNHGADRVQVYAGPQPIVAGTATPGVPGPAVVTIVFTAPFTYYPAGGKDLVLDFVSAGLASVGDVPALDASKDGATALARSVQSLRPTSATGGLEDAALAIEFTYTDGADLTAAFAVDVSEGPAPLTVNFSDLSYSSDPAGITSWAWDFDNDGTVDSTVQNPSFTYTICGASSVALTVVDATGSATATDLNLILTDEVDASFESDVAVGPGPLTVQFTDTSTGTPTAWAWDLDGDAVVDSTLQNPSFTYATTNVFDVTLTVTRNCNTSTITKPSFIKVSDALTTLFGNSNGIDPPGGVFFDVTVKAPGGIEITGLEQNINEALGTPFNLDLYITSAGWSGKDDDASLWRKVASGTGVSAGPANPSFVAMNSVFLPQGNYGFAIYADVRQRYVNGVTPVTTVANSDLELNLGRARSSFFGDPAPGVLLPFYEPRVWNGSVLYTTSPGAVYNPTGEGCPHSAGYTNVTLASGDFALGRPFSVEVSPLPASSPLTFLIIGYTNVQYQGTPLPLDLTPFGLTGCTLYAEPFAIEPLFAAGGVATWSAVVPTDPAFLGQAVFNQALVIDPTANAVGAVLSDGAAGVIGN